MSDGSRVLWLSAGLFLWPLSVLRLKLSSHLRLKIEVPIFFIVAPGQTNDAAAYEQTLLHESIEYFAAGAFIAGDAAYMLTEHLLVPFTGGCKQDRHKGSYIFYLSQLRIQIEMSFGTLDYEMAHSKEKARNIPGKQRQDN
jgi:hypothetical protein